MRTRALIGLVAVLAACESKPPPEQAAPVALTVRTLDANGAPVGHVHFFINGKKFGITNADGVFTGSHSAAPGSLLTFDLQPPAGFQTPIERTRWQQAVGDGAVEFVARLRATEQTYLFMVRGPARMPVELDDRVIGRTDDSGLALITAAGVPGAAFSLRAGELTTRAVFADAEELYLLTATRSGGLSSTQAAPPTSTSQPARARAAGSSGGVELPVEPERAALPESLPPVDGPIIADGPLVDPEAVSARVSAIQTHAGSGAPLTREHVDFLRGVSARHVKHGEANRLLGAFYFRLEDYQRQTEALERATKRGRYKHDPRILLSLAQGYARQKNYRRAIATSRRVEAKMRRLPAKEKAAAYRLHAEVLEFEFLRQAAKTDEPDVTLLERAIEKWSRCRTFARGANADGVAQANARIEALTRMKADFDQ